MKALKPHNNTIEAPEKDYLFVATSQIAASGKGLFTAITIYKDEVIALFKGEILTDLQIRSRIKKGNDKYFINMVDGSMMDSMNTKCFAKYANDADGFSGSKYKNSSKIALDEDNNVCIVATRNIKTNEEIFCCYGKNYWKKHNLV